jgi:hypothetical protein
VLWPARSLDIPSVLIWQMESFDLPDPEREKIYSM